MSIPCGGLEVITQKYPAEATGLELRALRSTIDLQGFSASYATAEIECAPVNSHVGGDDDADRIAWWKQFIPDLDDERIKASVSDSWSMPLKWPTRFSSVTRSASLRSIRPSRLA